MKKKEKERTETCLSPISEDAGGYRYGSARDDSLGFWTVAGLLICLLRTRNSIRFSYLFFRTPLLKLGPTNLKEWCLHRWGAASTSTCGVPFAAFISVGSSKVAIRIGLSAYPEFSLLLLLESVGPLSITSLWCRSFLCCSPYHPPLPILSFYTRGFPGVSMLALYLLPS